jgi:hypothetical protein
MTTYQCLDRILILAMSLHVGKNEPHTRAHKAAVHNASQSLHENATKYMQDALFPSLIIHRKQGSEVRAIAGAVMAAAFTLE